MCESGERYRSGMAEIATRRGETLTQKHARLERAHLTPEEDRFIEAESALEFAREQWEAADQRTTASRALAAQVEAARKQLEAAIAALGGPLGDAAQGTDDRPEQG